SARRSERHDPPSYARSLACLRGLFGARRAPAMDAGRTARNSGEKALTKIFVNATLLVMVDPLRRGTATSGVLMKPFPSIVLCLAFCTLGVCLGQESANPTSKSVTNAPQTRPTPEAETKGSNTLRLGNFCLSLAVKDLAVSRAFYEKLGFRVVS